MSAPRELPEVIWLEEALKVVADFGRASLELVAWELSLPEEALVPAWEAAVTRGLIEPDGVDPETGEVQFVIRGARG